MGSDLSSLFSSLSSSLSSSFSLDLFIFSSLLFQLLYSLFLCLLSLSLCLCVMLCVMWRCVVCGSACGVCGVVCGVVLLVVMVCVWCVCVCVRCVWCGTLKKTWKTRMWIPTRLRACIQNVSVCTGNRSTCINTCGRGAGTHVDVLNVHTEAFLIYTREEGRGGHRQFCLSKIAHVELSRASEVHRKQPLDVTHL